MYNFIVLRQPETWSSPINAYDSNRYGEFTSDSLRDMFDKLNNATIKKLKMIPTLFANENTAENVRVGYLLSIKYQGKTLKIKHEFEPDIPEIPFAKIYELKSKLDIRKYELNRMHWAVKDTNLFEVLYEAGLIDKKFVSHRILSDKI